MKTIELDEKQRAAVENIGNTLIMGGPGTGKTTVILEKIISLMQAGVDPKRILLLTFTQGAARKMFSQLKQYLNWSDELMAGTFQNFCLKVLRNMSQYEGYILIDKLDQKRLISPIASPYTNLDDQITVNGIVDLYSYARKKAQPISEYLQELSHYDESIKEKILTIIQKYEDRKETERYLDLEDLLIRFVSAIDLNLEFRNKMKGLYDYIFVDEAQELNTVQWQILDALRDPAILYLTGDDTLSICSSDGADFRSLSSVESRIPGIKIFHLEENHRSTQEILNLSKWVLGQSPLAYETKLYTNNDEGYLPVLINEYYSENEWLIRSIISHHKKGNKWSDAMIIVRNVDTAGIIEKNFIENQIPFRFIGGLNILQSAHTRDLISILRLGIKKDELSLYHYLNLFPGIGDATANRIINELKSVSHPNGTIAFLRDKYPDTLKIANGLSIVSYNLHDPHKAITQVINELSSILSEKYEYWEIRKKDLMLIMQLAKNFHSIEEFLDFLIINPVTSSQIIQKKADAVTLTTAPFAKGMESEICYLYEFRQNMYQEESDSLEEERRLLYVAMTCAKNELFIIGSKGNLNVDGCHKNDSGINNTKQYFLNNIPEDLAVTMDDTDDEELEELGILPYLGCFDEYCDYGWQVPF